MKIAILGTGTVGQTIASKIISLGHHVMIGTRNVSEKLQSKERDGYGNPPFSEWYTENSKVKLGSFKEAAAFGEIIINATKGGKTIEVLNSAGVNNLDGKILVDIANPLDSSMGMPPGLITELSNTNSLGEEVQKTFPGVKVVKTLNTMWCGIMVDPAIVGGGDHTNFICGNDKEAKEQVKSLLKEFGWKDENIIDIGDISSARGSEAILPIWLRIFMATQSGAFNFKIVK